MLVSAVELGGWLKEHAGQNRICSITTLTPVKMVVKHRITKEPNPWLMQGESIVDHLQERLTAFGDLFSRRGRAHGVRVGLAGT